MYLYGGKMLDPLFQLETLLDLLLSVVLGFLIGFERKLRYKEAGIRTHTIVCVGAALMMIVSKYAFGEGADTARVAAQIVAGVGFLGAGIIVYKKNEVHGLTTAAGVWATATIGLALGIGFYEGALLVFAATFLTVTLLHKLEYKLGKQQRRFGIYVEINSDKNIRHAITALETKYGASGIQVTSARSGVPGNVGIEANINNLKNQNPPAKISTELEELDFVIFAIESV